MMIKIFKTNKNIRYFMLFLSLAPFNFINAQKFEPNLESFSQYTYPDWFRDAKFGIWAHWGPQSFTAQGEWYARNMYEQDHFDRTNKVFTGEPHNDYLSHLAIYGHPT